MTGAHTQGNEALLGLKLAFLEETRIFDRKSSQYIDAVIAFAKKLEDNGFGAQALPYREQTLTLLTEMLGGAHPGTLAALDHYACGLQSAGRTAEALPHIARALQFRTRELGERHPATAESANKYAEALASLDRPAEALPYFKQALQFILEKETRYQILRLYFNRYIGALLALGRYAEALPYCEQTLTLSAHQFGESHPWTIDARMSFTSTLKALGRYTEALPYLLQALRLSTKKHGEGEWISLEALGDYVEVLHKLGRHEEAVPHCKRAAAQLADMDPHIFTPFGRFDLPQKHTGNASYEHALRDGMGRAFQLASGNLGVVRIYASALFRLERFDQALPHYEQAWRLRAWAFGEKHADTWVALNNYAYLLCRLDRAVEALQHYECALGLVAEALSGHGVECLSLESLGSRAAHVRASLARTAVQSPRIEKLDPVKTTDSTQRHNNGGVPYGVHPPAAAGVLPQITSVNTYGLSQEGTVSRVDKLFASVAAENAAWLANAETEARASGKELFLLSRLEVLYGEVLAHREVSLKPRYYRYAEIRTLADFVKHLREHEVWE